MTLLLLDERGDIVGERGSPLPPLNIPSTPAPSTPATGSPADEIMHIYKEGKIGGNACTKILFFVIMSILAGTITIVIVQHRGMSDESLAKGILCFLSMHP